MKRTIIYLFLFIILALAIEACKKTETTSTASCSDGIQNQGETGVDCGGPCSACPQVPAITTGTISSITGTTAKCNGSITSSGSTGLTFYGVCWSTSANPTIADSFTTESTSSFQSNITHLDINSTYHVRAYATNSVGTGYGNDLTFTTSSTLSFGDFYAGGLVFYLDSTQLHGYVCAEADQNTSNSWGCEFTLVTGANLSVIGSGITNTQLIEAAGCANGYAAGACYNLIFNGYSDWFLPSIDELHSMAVNLASNGIGNFSNNYYWSSTQGGQTQAWEVAFPSGTSNGTTKSSNNNVRAARSF